MLALLFAIVPMQTAEWPMEELVLTNGSKFEGIILMESPAEVRFRMVHRPVNRPTVTLTSLFPRAEVKSLKRLPEAQRKILVEKLAELDDTTIGERKRADALTLAPCTWPGLEKAAFRYESDDFTLVASTNEEITRRTAIRLEQTFLAYHRFLPARVKKAQPIAIYLAVDHDDYLAVYSSVLNLRNPLEAMQHPAAYDPKSNSVFCGTNLRQLGADLSAARLHHVQQLAAVKRYEETIAELYKNAPRLEREKHQQAAAEERAKVYAADRRNDAKYDEAMTQLYAKLYHESFHAYAFSFVYPENAKRSLPRWLNEGLAQIFESAILDGYELRFGKPDPDRLSQVQAALKNPALKQLLSINELLLSGETDFALQLPGSTNRGKASYLTAWAVAYHLMFERRLVATPAFDDYLKALADGQSPRTAFEKLVGKDLPAYEVEFNDYYRQLK